MQVTAWYNVLQLVCEGLEFPYTSPSAFSLLPVWSGVGKGPQSGPSCPPTVGAALWLRVFPKAHHPGTVSLAALEGVALPVVGGVAECTHPSAAPQCEQDDVWGSQGHGRCIAKGYLEIPASDNGMYYPTTSTPHIIIIATANLKT